MSGLMQQIMFQLGIEQFKSTAYHPESQGALERFHQTLKNMLQAFCTGNGKDWDEGVHLVLFAAREAVQESLGFSSFKLLRIWSDCPRSTEGFERSLAAR